MRRHLDTQRRRRAATALAALAVLVSAAVACGNGSTSNMALTTLGHGGGTGQSPAGSGGAPGGTTSTADSGVTVTTSDAGDDGGPLDSVEGRQLFEAMLPTLDTTCGGSCHAQGAGGAPLWLGPPDPFVSAVQFPGIVVSNPASSIVLTKGRHEGPALQDPLLTQMTQWLNVEAAALPVTVLPQTPPFTVANGANDIDCSKAGIAGVHITFDAAVSGTLMTLTNVDIVAPTTTGVHVTYPIFAILPASAPEIDDSSFSNDDQTVDEGQTAPLGPGTLILTEWVTGAQMKIEFTTIAAVAATADSGTLAGGCKALSSFETNAVPAIQANQCLNCHNTGGSGNNAMDLSGLASNPVDDAAACAQALSHADPADPAQSQIILAPTGQLTNHPFTQASQSFVTMMETWIAAEN